MKKNNFFKFLFMSILLFGCHVNNNNSSNSQDENSDSSQSDINQESSNNNQSDTNQESSSNSESLENSSENSSTTNDENSDLSNQDSSSEDSSNQENTPNIEQPNNPIANNQGEITQIGDVSIISSYGLYEGGYITFSSLENVDNYSIYIKGGKYKYFYKLDQNVAYIRQVSNEISRVDFMGLPAGTYEVKIVPIYDGIESIDKASSVRFNSIAYDRSGYAHFNYNEGVGAYNDDGSLKDNAIVIYVTNENKDYVMEQVSQLNDYMFNIPTYFSNSWNGKKASGIGWWLNNTQYSKCEKNSSGVAIESKSSNTYSPDGTSLGFASVCKDFPIVIRFVGTVKAPEGLTAYDSLNEGGSVGDNGNMARMKNLRNVTLEGVGDDAIIDGWGFHFICSDTTKNYGKNFEARNLTFKNYTEDALGMEGAQSGNIITAPVQRCWIHHITFLPGYCANPAESDKGQGDGSCDFKRGLYFTMSYCYYEYCHKTNLVGSSDSSLQYNISFHHNTWYNCGSRIPLLRNANIHFYNNYIYGDINDDNASLSYVSSLRADCYMFAEANYYEGCKIVLDVKDGKAKMYQNEYLSCFKEYENLKQFIVENRNDYIDNNCSYNGISYKTFDCDSSLFYYDEINQVSDCYLTSATIARLENIMLSGSYYRTMLNTTSLKLNASSNKYNVEESIVFDGQTYYATLTKDVGILYTNVSKGKFKDQGITFRLNEHAIIEVTLTGKSSDMYYDGYVVSETGQIMLSGSGKAYLSPGLYYISSSMFDKETVISSLSFTKYDDENYNQLVLDEYLKALNNIPEVISYTQQCYDLILDAKLKYQLLPVSIKANVDYDKVKDSEKVFIDLGIDYVEGLIDKIGNVTIDSNANITLARNEFEKLLSIDGSVKVSNYEVLVNAEQEFKLFAVNSCIEKINDIGTVTLDSKEKIYNALNEYESLDESQKEQVSNYQVLKDAILKYESLNRINDVENLILNVDLTSIASLQDAIQAYDLLSSEEKESIVNKDKYSQIKVTCTILLIDEIKEVDESSLNAISKAKNMYDSLSEDEKLKVSNYDNLKQAIDEFNQIQSSKVVHVFVHGSSSAYTYQDEIFTIKGNTSKSKGEVTYNGTTYSQCLKIESSTSIVVNCLTEKTLILVLNTKNNIKIDGQKVEGIDNSETSGSYIIKVTLSAGSHSITKADSANLFYIELY